MPRQMGYEALLVKKRKDFIENFWLNLGDVSKIPTKNILLATEDWQKEHPMLHILNVMRKPENFAFTIKHLFNIKIHPFQQVILNELWTKPFPMLIATRGGSKSYNLALYSLLKAIFVQGSKIVLTGAAFRQAKLIFEYCENIWKNSEMVKSIYWDDHQNRTSRDVDRWQFKIGTSTITAIPTGNGETIRGLRASDLIVDEFDAMSLEVYEHVIQGFTSVSATPMDNVIQYARLEALKELGEITQEQLATESESIIANKSIVAGTCGYTFGNLGKYYQQYKKIIESKGDIGKLEEAFNGEIPPGTNWKDYTIIRLPYTVMPKKFMEEKAIGKAKATLTKAIFMAEYGACFITDSDGFFKRSLIENCTCGKKDNPIIKESCGLVHFTATLRGVPTRKYVMGVDPASEIDNFAIYIVEMHPDHRRIVYGWTINKKRFKAKVAKGLTDEHDYYRHCARKVRDLNKVFPCEVILVDSQGGGFQIQEALGDPKACRDGELPIYHVQEEDEERHTDDLPGLHILQLVNFADAKWTNEANNGLKKDMEDRRIIFPDFDQVEASLAWEEDKVAGRIRIDDAKNVECLYDSLEDCMLEIEELKNELTLIVHTKTDSGRDKWDTPEIKTQTGKKGHLRKDRYSALLMANMGARLIDLAPTSPEYQAVGAIAKQATEEMKKDRGKRRESGPMYVGQGGVCPSWIQEKIGSSQFLGTVVKRKG